MWNLTGPNVERSPLDVTLYKHDKVSLYHKITVIVMVSICLFCNLVDGILINEHCIKRVTV